MKKKGFTLIELVVVMAIIAVLSLLIIAAIAAARRQSNLTAVTGDTKTYEIALEAYAAQSGGKYPITTTATKVDAAGGLSTVLTTFLSTTPKQTTIWYRSDANGAAFTLTGCSPVTTDYVAPLAGTVATDAACTGGTMAYTTVR